MSDGEETGFIIRDRRGRPETESGPTSPGEPEPTQQSLPQSEASESELPPQVTFSSFIFSLGTSSLMLMGETLDPQQPALPVNLPQAKEIIDVLSMLELKTKGNLTPEEQAVMGDMLYTLRLKYVDRTSNKHKT